VLQVSSKNKTSPLSDERNIGKLIYASIVFISIILFVESITFKSHPFIPLSALALSLLLIPLTFSSKVPFILHKVVVTVGLYSIVALHSYIANNISHFEIAAIPILCIIALYHDKRPIIIGVCYTLLLYIVGTTTSPDLTIDTLHPENPVFDLIMKLYIYFSGATVLLIMININNRQLEQEKVHAQNVNCLLRLVEIKKAEAEEADFAKTAFLANMSHKIRTPMNAICGMTELLEHSELTPINAEYVGAIKSSANNILETIDGILDLSKINSEKMALSEADYCLSSTINDVQNIISAQIAGKNIVLTVDVSPAIPSMLNGDEARVRQLLLNIMDNAAKFTNEGHISLNATFEPIDNEHTRIIFRISDTGIGIKPEDQVGIFDEFTHINAKRSHHAQGAGLGLAISHHLASLMDGQISLESTYGKGSCFTIEIIQKISDTTPCVNTDNFKNVNLLVCEPNSHIRNSIIKTAEALGVTYTLLDSAERLSLVKKTNQLQNFFIFDYSTCIVDVRKMLGDMKIKNILPVAMVSINDVADETLGKDMLFIRKPFTVFSVVSMINEKSGIEKSSRPASTDFICPDAKFLVVDDNAISLKVAEGLMGIFKPQITLVQSGAEALKLINGGNRYDIIFMDHMMPDMDGIEATEHIREIGTDYAKNVPIIALTANTIKGMDKVFIEAGMSDFLAKPFDSKTLGKLLVQWLPEYKRTALSDEENSNPVGEKINIEGINPDVAIERFSGDKDIYFKILSDVTEKGRNQIERLQKCYDERNYKDYTIEVHALKSVCASIGADKLSADAFEQEKAGKSEDFDFIDDNAPKLLEDYSALLDRISDYFKADNT